MEITGEEPSKDLVPHGKKGALKRYMELILGEESYGKLIVYEVITSLFGSLPGLVGYFFRGLLYRFLMSELGKNTIIGKNVILRGVKNIRIGSRVYIEDGVMISSRGGKSSIIIEDNVVIGRNSIIRTRGGELILKKGVTVGANCIVATDSKLVVGENTLIAAYCYISAGGTHRFEDRFTPIIEQGFDKKGGVVIGPDVWLGAHSTVLDGVEIGKGSVIGAYSLVNTSLPEGVVAYGIPVRVYRVRGEDGAG